MHHRRSFWETLIGTLKLLLRTSWVYRVQDSIEDMRIDRWERERLMWVCCVRETCLKHVLTTFCVFVLSHTLSTCPTHIFWRRCAYLWPTQQPIRRSTDVFRQEENFGRRSKESSPQNFYLCGNWNMFKNMFNDVFERFPVLQRAVRSVSLTNTSHPAIPMSSMLYCILYSYMT